MKVLVTGGAGYIGSHTCLALLELGYDVVAVDNFCNSSPESLKRVEELTGKKVPLYGIDVRDEAALDRVFREHDIGCAIHFAGLKAVGESVQIPLAYYENNLLSTMTLLKVMGKNGVKRIIFSSSATVYSTENAMPLNETEHGEPNAPQRDRAHGLHQSLRLDQVHVRGDYPGLCQGRS